MLHKFPAMAWKRTSEAQGKSRLEHFQRWHSRTEWQQCEFACSCAEKAHRARATTEQASHRCAESVVSEGSQEGLWPVSPTRREHKYISELLWFRFQIYTRVNSYLVSKRCTGLWWFIRTFVMKKQTVLHKEKNNNNIQCMKDEKTPQTWRTVHKGVRVVWWGWTAPLVWTWAVWY